MDNQATPEALTLALTYETTHKDTGNTVNFNWDMPIPAELTPIQIGLLRKGFSEVLADAFSTAKDNQTIGDKVVKVPASLDTRVEKTLTRLAKLKDGTYTFKGQKAPPLTPAQVALKAACKASGIEIKGNIPILEAIEVYTKALAETQNKPFAPSMVETVKAYLESTDIYISVLKAEIDKKNVVKDVNLGLLL